MTSTKDFPLCQTEFWNISTTWYPENGPPDFTVCFHKTVLVWLPCAILWLGSPIDFKRARTSNAGPIPWSIINILKLFILTMLLATSAGELIISCSEAVDQVVAISDILAPLLKLFSFGLSMILVWLSKKAGIMASGVQWFFWLFMTVCQGFTFGSVLNNPYNPGITFSDANDKLIVISYACIVAMFFLNCFADQEPTYKDPKGKQCN